MITLDLYATRVYTVQTILRDFTADGNHSLNQLSLSFELWGYKRARRAKFSEPKWLHLHAQPTKRLKLEHEMEEGLQGTLLRRRVCDLA